MSYALSEPTHQDFGTLFEPDPLLPEKFYATFRKRHDSDPERRLMAAVLEDAVACLSVAPSGCSGRQRRAFSDAEQWINAPYNSDWIYSFSSVCESLEIDPDYLRRGLKQWIIQCRDQSHLAPKSRKDRAGVRHKHFRLRPS